MRGSFHIALCSDATMLPGLHATLGSLVRNLTRRAEISLTIFHENIAAPEIEALQGTITDAGGVGACSFSAADTSGFRDLKSLHGQWMTYLRLLLPRLLPDADTILYLDSDLVVKLDASTFFDLPLADYPIAAIDSCELKWSLDHAFLKSIGLIDEDRYFNAGVLVINAARWRKEGLVERALELAQLHRTELTSHDQSILNALFSRRFYNLPKIYNLQVAPNYSPRTDPQGIFHFVGSPKPWDLLGKYFHRNAGIWIEAIRPTRFIWVDFLSRHADKYLKRAWSLRNSYGRTVWRRLFPLHKRKGYQLIKRM